MTSATSESLNLGEDVGARGERKNGYGYVYEYVYGEEGTPNKRAEPTPGKRRGSR